MEKVNRIGCPKAFIKCGHMYKLPVSGSISAAMERMRVANVLQVSQPCSADTFKAEKLMLQGVLVQYPSEFVWQTVQLHPHSGFVSNSVSVMVCCSGEIQDCGCTWQEASAA